MYRYKYHFYNLIVEAGFYSDTGRVAGSFTKLGNGGRGKYLGRRQLVDFVGDRQTLQFLGRHALKEFTEYKIN